MNTKIQDILLKAKINFETFTYAPLKGGANNRVYKISLDQNKCYILKHYFSDKTDLRNRLFSEYSFLKYAWNKKIKNIPEPIYTSNEENLALYSYIPGKLAQVSDVTNENIQKAIEFIINLNSNKTKDLELPKASEACFCIENHLNLIDKRINRLLSLPKSLKINDELFKFLNSSLIPKWEKLKNRNFFDRNLETKDICISPSDFGFHNALINNSDIYFIDFEYAGLDDPAKLVCDFFCQPKIPVPIGFFNEFAKSISSITSNPDACLERINFLFPVYQIKWCCIILNVFIKNENNRRTFSQSLQDPLNQLDLAKTLLNKIKI